MITENSSTPFGVILPETAVINQRWWLAQNCPSIIKHIAIDDGDIAQNGGGQFGVLEYESPVVVFHGGFTINDGQIRISIESLNGDGFSEEIDITVAFTRKCTIGQGDGITCCSYIDGRLDGGKIATAIG